MGIDREGELPSLKKMTAKVLGKEIQGGVHDPVSPAITFLGCIFPSVSCFLFSSPPFTLLVLAIPATSFRDAAACTHVSSMHLARFQAGSS
jgi:hypothetical protein